MAGEDTGEGVDSTVSEVTGELPQEDDDNDGE